MVDTQGSIQYSKVIPGAHHLDQYIDQLKDKNVALVVNHTSVIADQHLVDVLVQQDVEVRAIFAPEHGFKGGADAGAEITDGLYLERIPVYSLYGKVKKPTSEMLEDVDIVVFDIQDVGARFYTYLSTLHYTMEAAAEHEIPYMILDRPNPNGHLIDGPIMQSEFMSFVGLHPVPIVYGMTIGEYGQMINGEGWLDHEVKADLTLVRCSGYDHYTTYEPPIAPSPNLPNLRSILLYPSLCLFEGTTISVGRGTTEQFQLYGHPDLDMSYKFTPMSTAGARYPKHQDQICAGVSLSGLSISDIKSKKTLDLSYLLATYAAMNEKNRAFFNSNQFFEKLAGTGALRKQITDGWTEEQIRASWHDDLEAFKVIRQKYLIY